MSTVAYIASIYEYYIPVLLFRPNTVLILSLRYKGFYHIPLLNLGLYPSSNPKRPMPNIN